MKNILLFALALILQSSYAHAQIITTIVGDGTNGLGNGGPADSAVLSLPIGIALDGSGNLYIGDRSDNRIRKVSASGIITTIAGTGVAGFSGDNGPATAAEIDYPYGVTVDATGNIYFADGGNSRIRMVNTSGIITTIAGTGAFAYNGDNIPATAAELDGPGGVFVDGSGNVYIADGHNNRVRKINTAGIITTIAGTGSFGYSGDNGQATAAELNQPYSITMDGSGNICFTEFGNSVIRKINPVTGIITTIAGTGTAGYNGDNIAATSAEFFDPCGIAIDGSGNIYVGDAYNNRVRKVNTSGIITTIAGTGTEGFSGDNGPATAAELDEPVGVAIDGIGNIYFTDAGNSRIRYIKSALSVSHVNIIEISTKIYPNPNYGDFVINISSNINEQALIKITNIAGELIMEFAINTNEPENIRINEPEGIYFLSTVSPHGANTEKLIIRKCC